MRFVSLVNSLVGKTRRGISQAASVHLHTDDDGKVKDLGELAKVLRQMTARVNKLEAALPPEATEFEVNVGSGGALVELFHNFKGPVRWWVTGWLQTSGSAYPVSGPLLAQDSSSTSTSLFLRSYLSGRAIIRVEPSQQYIDPGVIVVPTVVSADNPAVCLANNFTTTNATATPTGLSFAVKAGDVWRIHYEGTAGDSDANGMAFAVGAPAGSTIDAWHYSSTTSSTVRVYNNIGAINTLGSAVHTVANGGRDDQIIGTVKCAIDGTISIQVATVLAATTVTVYAKSSLIGKKLTEV